MLHRFLWLLTVSLLAACASTAIAQTPTSKPKPISVMVSIPPLKGIAAELGKSAGVEVQTLIPVGVSEHGYEIPTAKFRSLAKADLIVYVGRGLEPELAKYLRDHPIDAEANVVRERIEFAALIESSATNPKPSEAPPTKKNEKHEPGHKHDHDEPGHVHGPDCDHDHTGGDPHLWLDPTNMKKLVPAVSEAIERILKSRGELSADMKASLDAAEESVMNRIDETDAAYRATLTEAKGRTIVVAHDAYGLLATRYELKTVAIAGLHASEPTMNDVRKAIEAIKEKQASVVYIEPQLNRSAAQRVAKATGAKVLSLDPVGGDDWFATMSKNLDSLATGLGVERRTGK